MVDIRLRNAEITNWQVYCEKLKENPEIFRFTFLSEEAFKIKSKKFMLVNPTNVYKLFDTYEILNPNQYDEDTIRKGISKLGSESF